jgi:hypothetical protein
MRSLCLKEIRDIESCDSFSLCLLGEGFIVGAKVEARYGGGPKFYPGTVTSIKAEGRLSQYYIFFLMHFK